MKSTFYAAFAALLLAGPVVAQAQTTGGVRVGTAGAPDASAVLDVNASDKGFLPPRLSQAQRDLMPAKTAGLTIYNTTTNQLNVWNGTAWQAALADTSPAVEFAYTGAPQTYTVPAGITRLGVDLAGAGGGPVYAKPDGGGLGGRVLATLSVTPGETLTLYVGGAGSTNAAGYNGGGAASGGDGGGGGASDVRQGGAGLANRVL
ncbi:hypothetical protein JAO73_22550, partial [Hymenobacter sp. BT523]|uniref:glycine-rich protein n=1 Tax=Hymenobacter sp. BT523 TaxID=2795725 RepID=UPI001A2422D8